MSGEGRNRKKINEDITAEADEYLTKKRKG